MAIIPLQELLTVADPISLFKKLFDQYAMALLLVIPDTGELEDYKDLNPKNYQKLEAFWSST